MRGYLLSGFHIIVDKYVLGMNVRIKSTGFPHYQVRKGNKLYLHSESLRWGKKQNTVIGYFLEIM